MNKLVQFFLLLTIFLLGTQIIKLPGIGLSPFQIMVILTATIGIPFAMAKGLRSGVYIAVTVLWFFSSILAWQTSINPEWGKSYFLLGMMTTLILLIIPNVFTRRDLPRIERWLVRSQYIVIPFSLFFVMAFNAIGAMPDEVLLPGGLSITLGEGALDRGTAAGEVRLMLPYATPPVLSIVMAMTLTILLFNDELFKKWIRWSLVGIFGAILILTGSRSGIMGMILLFLLLLVKGEFKRQLKKVKKKYVILGIIVLVVLAVVLMQFEYFQKMIIDRFYNPDRKGISEDRHYLVPLDGLLIWIGSARNFILGIGFGSSMMMRGAHTYLPPYFLNSFVTLLAERGIMGLMLVILLIWLFARLFRLRRYMNKAEISITYAYFVVLASAMFYENFISYFVIFVIALTLMLQQSIERDIRKQRRLNNIRKPK